MCRWGRCGSVNAESVRSLLSSTSSSNTLKLSNPSNDLRKERVRECMSTENIRKSAKMPDLKF